MATVVMSTAYESENIYGLHTLPFVIGSYSAPGGSSGGYNGGGTLATGFERGNFWHGGVSHVAIYNYALAASQVSKHYFLATNNTIAPYIITQPASQVNYVGQTATFNVNAVGLTPLYYQWQAGATGSGVYTNLIPGGQFSAVTNTTLSISNLTMGNSEDYVVVVTNSAGSVTSAVATLTVLNPSPSITTQPASQTNMLGQTATFSVTAYGLPPVSYQWLVQSNGVYVNLSASGQFSGVTSATLTISSLVATNATNYEVLVTNASGSITSAVATLTLNQAPVITTQPASQTNIIGQTATLSVIANGLPSPSYQWQAQSNGVYVNLNAGGQFSGVTNATLTISSLALTNTTNYEVVVTNSAGMVTSAAAMLTVLPASPSITTQPASQTNIVGQTNTFTVAAFGVAPLSYQWQVESNGIYVNLNAGGQFSGATNTTLTISSLVFSNSTNYDVVVTNSAGSVTSAPATLTVISPPFIITQPSSQTNYATQTASFTVSASGLAPLSYQWQEGAAGGGGPHTNLIVWRAIFLRDQPNLDHLQPGDGQRGKLCGSRNQFVWLGDQRPGNIDRAEWHHFHCDATGESNKLCRPNSHVYRGRRRPFAVLLSMAGGVQRGLYELERGRPVFERNECDTDRQQSGVHECDEL